jgi:peptidoglycan hydrolase CwlO-like protein
MCVSCRSPSLRWRFQDTLNVSTSLLSHFSSALSQYSSHEQVIRDHLKAIRTREEGLDDMKRRKKSLLTKADSADKKLSKMSSEHKQLAMQTALLAKLNSDIKLIEEEIVVEETSMADFKRSTARSLLAHKFGGMLEFCEKGTVGC